MILDWLMLVIALPAVVSAGIAIPSIRRVIPLGSMYVLRAFYVYRPFVLQATSTRGAIWHCMYVGPVHIDGPSTVHSYCYYQ